MARLYAYRGFATHDIPRLRKRGNRAVEAFVDCYGDWEAAGAIEVYLSDALDYPFKADWRRPDGDRTKVTVVGLDENWEDETGLMFQVESGEGDEIAPAHQVYGKPHSRMATVLDDYRAWWPFDLVDAGDDDD